MTFSATDNYIINNSITSIGYRHGIQYYILDYYRAVEMANIYLYGDSDDYDDDMYYTQAMAYIDILINQLPDTYIVQTHRTEASYEPINAEQIIFFKNQEKQT